MSGQVYEAGVDTARFLYRLHDERQQEAADQWCGRRPGKLGPLSVGFLRSHELLWVEGRPTTLYEDSHRLMQPDALPDAERLVRELLHDHGATDARSVGLSRLDATVTMEFERPAEGWALLRGLAAVDVPLRKPETIGRPPETVYWLTPSGVRRERVYDTGLQKGTGEPGTQIRMEAQMRFRADQRTTAEWWNMERVRESFQRRFEPMAKSSDGLRVASEATLREQIRDLVERERITPGQAERLLGFIATQAVGIRSTSRRTRFRRRGELRRLGLAQALDGIDGDDDLHIDLGEVLADVVGADHWHA